MSSTDKIYLKSLYNVYQNGNERIDRTSVGTRSIFGLKTVYETEFFPILFSKKINFKAVIAELLWFLKGSTNSKELEDIGVNIWKEWAKPDGSLGPIYGSQWRSWLGHDKTPIDQLENAVNLLISDPYSRRNIVSAWNVSDLNKMALPPCHLLFQFYVSDDTGGSRSLDLQLYQRSGDMFLGVPFNITSYSILMYIMCDIVNNRNFQLKNEEPYIYPGKFHHVIGDAHIYLNHMDQVKEQLLRTVNETDYAFLKIKNRDQLKFEDFKIEDFELENYYPQSFIKAPIAV